ncbi:MAG: COX15/CtaA family protein [Planctomycetes bacterium]|nr:COX15/CtaA family protein [Planctomycetota bacterium]
MSLDLPPEGKWLYRNAVTLVVVIFLTMKIGAMVTSTDSGMAFRTWPDANGYYLWPKDSTAAMAFEHSHRLLGALAGLVGLLLTGTVLYRDPRRPVRRLAIGMLGLIVVQGILGGYRVLLNDHFPVLFPVLHGMMAQVVLCTAAVLAFTVSTAWVCRSIENGTHVRTLRRMATGSLGMVFLQVLVGVWFRHSNSQAALWIHVSFATVVSLTLLITVSYGLGKFRTVPGFARTNRICLGVLLVQLLLGFVTLMVRRDKGTTDTETLGRAVVQSLHVLLGATLFLIATILLVRSYRNLVPRVGPTPDA